MTKKFLQGLYFLLILLSAQSYGQKQSIIRLYHLDIDKTIKEWKNTKTAMPFINAEYDLVEDKGNVVFVFKNKELASRIYGDGSVAIRFKDSLRNKTVELENKKYKVELEKGVIDWVNIQSKKQDSVARNSIRNQFKKEFSKRYNDSTWKELARCPQDSFITSLEKVIFSFLKDSVSAKDTIVYTNRLKQYANFYTEARDKTKEQFKEHIKSPSKILKSALIRDTDYKWKIVLDSSGSAFLASGCSVDFVTKKKSFIKITFDTLMSAIPERLPILDSAWCGGNLINQEILEAGKNLDTKQFNCKQLAGVECFGRFSPPFYERKDFIVYFEKNETQKIKGSLKPALDYLRDEQLMIKKVKITAFASIEGDSVKNFHLASSRSQIMIDALQAYDKDTLDAEVTSQENWAAFFKDLPKTPMAEAWKGKDSVEIRKLINDSTYAQTLEPWLSKHRYSKLELYSMRNLTNKQKIEKFAKQYSEWFASMKTQKNPATASIYENKIAAFRYFLIKEYRLNRFTDAEVSVFFKEMTPNLAIANFFQQIPLLLSNKTLLGTNPDSLFIKTMGAIQNSAVIAGMAGKDGENPAQLDFSRQVLLMLLNQIDKGVVNEQILSGIQYPSSDAYADLSYLVEASKSGQVIKLKSKTNTVVFEEKKDASGRTLFTDYTLKSCVNDSSNVMCKSNPNYTAVKNTLLKKLTTTKSNLLKKVFLQFIETQIAETKAFDKKLYDDELPPEKVYTSLQSLKSLNLCSVQWDRLRIEACKNIILYVQPDESGSLTKKYLNEITEYYAKQRKYMTSQHLEMITRFILYFKQNPYNGDDYTQFAQTFLRRMTQGKDKDFSAVQKLQKKIDYFNTRNYY